MLPPAPLDVRLPRDLAARSASASRESGVLIMLWQRAHQNRDVRDKTRQETPAGPMMRMSGRRGTLKIIRVRNRGLSRRITR